MRLIDADALLKEVIRIQTTFADNYCNTETQFAIENATTIEAEPTKHGRWKIIDQDVMGRKTLMCSCCTSVTKGFTFPNYCFNCGAKMDEEEK